MKQSDIDETFRSLADAKNARFTARIYNSPKKLYVVKVPLLRKYGKEVLKDDWRTFVSLRSESLEQSMVKALVIANAKCSGNERLALTREYINEIGEWSTCDMLCGEWKVNDSATGEELFAMCKELLGTGKEFPMRVGAVMMLSKFVDDEHIDTVLEELGRPRESPGYYWDMGCAWALSVCYVKFPEKTEPVILSGNLSPAILKMTLQKIRDSYRVEESDKKRLTECARSL